ncbi:MAG: late competence development ComFB family protein [Roseofilum sp. SBFL]|uniref:late competence development ComFB family protein n=1 Tax=unclassified Roseofilum TaxID=2620099 RepID=UPI001B20D43A|nr:MULTISPECIES: late competence development ComFB family protein [unclassified Roseofilum]MBP0015597.1 late competence development ComFB family protein [Roseofilum sp. SID3]MBP0022694.1 late competence development ComFB family protein [Roseofilum sp. SID2]MBP0039254.1 late competence development ComFB family protein [Roseofilum sp. SID1]MBP0042664.1 late competence development ComFB family protein [Roseofilum sp. SBFL]
MSIQEIVEQALKDGYLTPAMEAEVGNICDNASELSIEEYMALDRLMGCLLTGEVVAVPRKQFINVMEELVLTESMSCVAAIEEKDGIKLDLGDVAAYALNRLPPLYATTEEGARYQRDRAKQELMALIKQQVGAAISKNQEKPQEPERQALGKTDNVLSQVSHLLQNYAQTYEKKPQPLE